MTLIRLSHHWKNIQAFPQAKKMALAETQHHLCQCRRESCGHTTTFQTEDRRHSTAQDVYRLKKRLKLVGMLDLKTMRQMRPDALLKKFLLSEIQISSRNIISSYKDDRTPTKDTSICFWSGLPGSPLPPPATARRGAL